MIEKCYINGVSFERGALPEGLYVYEAIMTVGHQPLHLGRYLQLLSEASEAILCRRVSLNEHDTQVLIEKFLRQNGYPESKPAYVELRIYRSGEVVLLGGEVSPYSAWGLRLLMPAGTDISCDFPYSEHRSSISRSIAEALQAEVEMRGAKVVVRFDEEGCACSVDDAEIFVVREYTVSTPRLLRSVEGKLVADAIQRAGMQLQIEAISREKLDAADEIFYADHRGITTLKSYNGHPLMHIIAEKISESE